MKYLVLMALVAVATAQFGGFQGIWDNIRDELQQQSTTVRPDGTTIRPDDITDDTIDYIHRWRLEDHVTDTDHLLLFINDQESSRYCYVIKVSRTWESLLTTEENVFKITEEIYALINRGNHRERPVRPGKLANDFHDFEAAKECTGHATYSIRYHPSFA